MRGRKLCSLLLAACGAALFAAGCGKPRTRQGSESLSVPAASAPLLSGKNTLVYHTRECRYCRDIPDKELVGFANPDAAEKDRRMPCAVCHPREASAIQTPDAGAPAGSQP